jgi:hypothetical protein
LILHIKKDAFKNLSNGVHTIKASFTDGYGESQVEVKDKITFTILGETFTATVGMTWAEWMQSYGIGGWGNYILWLNDNKELFIDHRYSTNWDTGVSLGSSENAFFDSNDVRQTLNDVIRDGGVYGRHSGAPN